MLFGALVNLDQPGRYFHWSIFTISIANLVLIAVMVIIFGLALLLPFPKGRSEKDEGSTAYPDNNRPDIAATPYNGLPADSSMWTARVRNFA